MNKLDIIESHPNYFEFKGDVTFWQTEYKSVKVKGEIYHKETSKEVTQSVDELYKKSFQEWEFDFDALNYHIKVKDYTRFNNGLSGFFRTEYSQKTYANVILHLFHKKKLDKKIFKVWTQKGNFSWRDIEYNIINCSEIPFILEGYGFNNFICYSVKIKDFFILDNRKVDGYVKEYFDRHKINLEDKKTVETALKILKLKIDKQ